MKKLLPLLLLLLGLVDYPHFARAAGNDNPTGVTGDYNGQITTGGSYDPYTGNGKRVVTDLDVTGSVGAYPLRWTRILNTRSGRRWVHSYTWGGWVRHGDRRGDGGGEDFYEGPDARIFYPRGQTVDFWGGSAYTSWLNDAPGDCLLSKGSGVYYLLMQDGGKVVFNVTSTSYYQDSWTESLHAVQIVDPHGLVTTLTFDTSNRLSRIAEPAGRYIQVNYNSAGAIGSVQAFASGGALIETYRIRINP